jgi:hypothetical protein
MAFDNDPIDVIRFNQYIATVKGKDAFTEACGRTVGWVEFAIK